MKNIKSEDQIIIYENEEGQPKIEVRIVDETVWLTQQQIATLYQSSRTNIVEHIKHIYEENELEESSTCRNFRQSRTEGNRTIEREMPFYNLDMIISLGYRVKSSIATKFRIWATSRLREYIIKGFAIDDDRLKNAGGGSYWKELLDRIRDIRSSEKVLYRQVLDLYATSVDYNPKSKESQDFFAIVQNKLHYAANGKTAAELVSERANADKPFMGLMTFSGNSVSKRDVIIAKNYLSEKEIKRLNNIVSAYFDIAELRALDEIQTTMKDYLSQLDKLIASMDRAVLNDAGKVSKIEAEKKAFQEYRKYQEETFSPVEEAYLENIKDLQKKIDKKQFWEKINKVRSIKGRGKPGMSTAEFLELDRQSH